MTHSTNFSSGTVVTSNWLNAVDDFVFDSVADAHAYGAMGDGVTDDTAALQAALNTHLPVKIYTGKTYKVTSALTAYNSIFSDGNADIVFTDGAYTGITFTGRSRFIIKGITLLGTNHTTPLITLMAITNSNYFNLFYVGFGFASTCLALDGCYICSTYKCNFSNADAYIKYSSVSYGTADYTSVCDTFGYTNIGTTNACVQIKAYGAKMVSGYFEVANNTKKAVEVFTGAGDFSMDALMYSSGSIVYRTSTSGKVSVRASECFHTTDQYFLRVDGGAEVTLSGTRIISSVLRAGVYAISASGRVITSDTSISKYGTGIGCGDIQWFGGLIDNCTTGMQVTGVGTVIEPGFSSNTTNAVVGGTVFYRKSGAPPTVSASASLVLPVGAPIVIISGATGITTIDTTGQDGHEVTLIFSTGLTVTDGSNLRLNGNFVATSEDTLTLVCSGVTWYEKSRSAN